MLMVFCCKPFARYSILTLPMVTSRFVAVTLFSFIVAESEQLRKSRIWLNVHTVRFSNSTFTCLLFVGTQALRLSSPCHWMGSKSPSHELLLWIWRRPFKRVLFFHAGIYAFDSWFPLRWVSDLIVCLASLHLNIMTRSYDRFPLPLFIWMFRFFSRWQNMDRYCPTHWLGNWCAILYPDTGRGDSTCLRW